LYIVHYFYRHIFAAFRLLAARNFFFKATHHFFQDLHLTFQKRVKGKNGAGLTMKKANAVITKLSQTKLSFTQNF